MNKARAMLGVLIGGLSACGEGLPEDAAMATGAARSALYLESGVRLWTQNSNRIPLCWATPGYAREKAIIRNAISRTWGSVARLDITWTEGCPRTGSTAYVKVQIGVHGMVDLGGGVMGYDHSTDGQARGYGMAALSLPSTQPLSLFGTPGITFWVEDNQTSRQPRMEYAAVHEFGHTLGFRHEQDSTDPGARSCSATSAPGTQIGAYDRDSIMNYCGSHGNNVGRLSAGDVHGVRSLYGARAVSGDYDGDGRTDFAVYDPSAGRTTVRSSSSGVSYAVGWGNPGDVPIPGDYDGDGKIDIAVFRPSEGRHYIIRSSNNTGYWVGWGNPGDVVINADYDGDGKTDLAVFRPSESRHYILRSSNGTSTGIGWGQPGDLVSSADYDGDGKADIAVFRPSEGRHYIIRSSTGASTVVGWGQPGDRPVPGDYDGDGRADVAIYRPGTGQWWVVSSITGTGAGLSLGAAGDVPLVGDYDGDGLADRTVWRPSDGKFYVWQSTSGATTTMQAGAAGHIPLPRLF